MLACSGSVDVAAQQIETPPHVVRLCRTRSHTLDSGCGSALVGPYLASLDVLEVLARSVLATRWGSGLQANKSYPLVRSVGMPPSPPRRKACPRGCIPPQSPGKSNFFEFVLRNTMPVLSVMKVWGCRLSVRSCHHQCGRMMSRALTHRTTYVAFFGGGDSTVASDVRGTRGTGKTGVSQD